jgi:hypothetical protein
MSVKFKHKEAFCLMTYECENCERQAEIWNSRDGVTPFMVRCRHCKDGTMKHIDWANDVLNPEYRLEIGDLVFVTQTEEEYIQFQKERAEKIWISNEDCRDNYDSLEEFQKCLSSSGYQEGHPVVREVTLGTWRPRY